MKNEWLLSIVFWWCHCDNYISYDTVWRVHAIDTICLRFFEWLVDKLKRRVSSNEASHAIFYGFRSSSSVFFVVWRVGDGCRDWETNDYCLECKLYACILRAMRQDVRFEGVCRCRVDVCPYHSYRLFRRRQPPLSRQEAIIAPLWVYVDVKWLWREKLYSHNPVMFPADWVNLAGKRP